MAEGEISPSFSRRDVLKIRVTHKTKAISISNQKSDQNWEDRARIDLGNAFWHMLICVNFGNGIWPESHVVLIPPNKPSGHQVMETVGKRDGRLQ